MEPLKNYETSGARRPGRWLTPGALMMLLVAAGWLAVASAPRARAAPAASREYEVKAAYLFNFVQFVDWPATAFADANAPVVIGVLGDDPFGAVLVKIVEGETAHGRKIVVKPIKQADIKECHLVFVCKSEKPRIPQIVAGLGDASVLAVGETDGFAVQGGVMNFILEGNKVRFEINAEAAKRRGLKVSAQLLRLGKLVG